MPYDLDTPLDAAHDARHGARRRRGPTLLEGAVELMLRAQSGAGLDEPALREELRRLVAATHDPAADLWDAYSAGRGFRTARWLYRSGGSPHRD